MSTPKRPRKVQKPRNPVARALRRGTQKHTPKTRLKDLQALFGLTP